MQVASLPAAAADDVDIAPTCSRRPRGRTVNYSLARRMPVTFAGSAAADRRTARAGERHRRSDGWTGGPAGRAALTGRRASMPQLVEPSGRPGHMTSALSSWRFINHVIPSPRPYTIVAILQRRRRLDRRYDALDSLALRYVDACKKMQDGICTCLVLSA